MGATEPLYNLVYRIETGDFAAGRSLAEEPITKEAIAVIDNLPGDEEALAALEKLVALIAGDDYTDSKGVKLIDTPTYRDARKFLKGSSEPVRAFGYLH